MNTQTKAVGHTPGPWLISEYPSDGDYAVHGQFGPETDLIAILRYRREFEANARLIAAAPELLAACKAVYTATARSMEAKRLKLLMEAIVDVDAAIAKAEGKQ